MERTQHYQRQLVYPISPALQMGQSSSWARFMGRGALGAPLSGSTSAGARQDQKSAQMNPPLSSFTPFCLGVAFQDLLGN